GGRLHRNMVGGAGAEEGREGQRARRARRRAPARLGRPGNRPRGALAAHAQDGESRRLTWDPPVRGAVPRLSPLQSRRRDVRFRTRSRPSRAVWSPLPRTTASVPRADLAADWARRRLPQQGEVVQGLQESQPGDLTRAAFWERAAPAPGASRPRESFPAHVETRCTATGGSKGPPPGR